MPIYNDKIEAQYSEHPYPKPILNMDERIEQGYQQGSCLALIWQRLFPEKEYKENINILIAGCGTNQAVYHALKFPKSQHYAIDVSETSIAHVRNMIEKYNIKNLIVEKKDILELENKNEFDFVISTGVLHHTEDPQKSLNRLVETTKDDGALFIMVYASYLRMGVYFLQDAFGYLDLKNTKEDINVAKRLIELISKKHYVHEYLDSTKIEGPGMRSSPDMHYDAGFVDTFFNARDVSFNIDELKIFINKSGSYFQGWYDNEYYYRKLFDFGVMEKLNKNYMNLNHWELSDFTQKISPLSGKFSFILRKGKKYENRFFKIDELTTSIFVRKLPFKESPAKDVTWDIKGVSKNIEKIIWLNIDNKIEDILEKSNEVISKEGFEEELSFNNIQMVLHHYWKEGKISFSDR
jgi:SAM-dependent methyltransferase